MGADDRNLEVSRRAGSGDLGEAVRRLALASGFTDCGFTGVTTFTEDRAALGRRMARFPEAADHYARMLRRTDPLATTPWARSVVVCIRRYGKYRLPQAAIGHIGRNYLADRRVKGCPDYALDARMAEGFRQLGIRAKKGGTPDRWAAVRAGVARFGRNCFVYAKHGGSWINLETWRIDAELPPTPAAQGSPCPPGCRACIDACPTGAIVDPYCMRLDRCIAYLTYSAPHPIAPELWNKMGPWIYGCDRCQEVCPLNRGQWEDREEAAWLAEAAPHLSPQALAEMSEEVYRQTVQPLFWYIPASDLARWHANARRACAHREKTAP